MIEPTSIRATAPLGGTRPYPFAWMGCNPNQPVESGSTPDPLQIRCVRGQTKGNPGGSRARGFPRSTLRLHTRSGSQWGRGWNTPLPRRMDGMQSQPTGRVRFHPGPTSDPPRAWTNEGEPGWLRGQGLPPIQSAPPHVQRIPMGARVEHAPTTTPTHAAGRAARRSITQGPIPAVEDLDRQRAGSGRSRSAPETPQLRSPNSNRPGRWR
jgi:hypothetical protein